MQGNQRVSSYADLPVNPGDHAGMHMLDAGGLMSE